MSGWMQDNNLPDYLIQKHIRDIWLYNGEKFILNSVGVEK
jgi:hypothetical protein